MSLPDPAERRGVRRRQGQHPADEGEIDSIFTMLATVLGGLQRIQFTVTPHDVSHIDNSIVMG